MSVTTDHDTPDLAISESPPARSGWLVKVLVGVIVAGLVGASFALGTLVGGKDDTSTGAPVPADASIEVGFARDMITHHDQAIRMAGITRDHSTDSDIRLVAFDIETGQLAQLGQMQGWLQVWNKNPNNPGEPMSWMPASDMNMDMGHSDGAAVMPGMATTADIEKLQKLRGKELDVFFLQLMIRHHQGGIPMAQYAADHAKNPVVKDLADKMVKAQSAEVITMEQDLRKRGATPLPPP